MGQFKESALQRATKVGTLSRAQAKARSGKRVSGGRQLLTRAEAMQNEVKRRFEEQDASERDAAT